jgi:hypothetical protein
MVNGKEFHDPRKKPIPCFPSCLLQCLLCPAARDPLQNVHQVIPPSACNSVIFTVHGVTDRLPPGDVVLCLCPAPLFLLMTAFQLDHTALAASYISGCSLVPGCHQPACVEDCSFLSLSLAITAASLPSHSLGAMPPSLLTLLPLDSFSFG